jgi:hypothetical protein
VHAFSGQLASRTAAHENKNWLRFISHTFLKFCVALILSSAILLRTVFFHLLFLGATYASSFIPHITVLWYLVSVKKDRYLMIFVMKVSAPYLILIYTNEG